MRVVVGAETGVVDPEAASPYPARHMSTTRRTFLTGSFALLAAPLGVEAQQASKVNRVGVLSIDAPPPGLIERFREGLHELGYVEGKNVVIELRNAGGSIERLSVMADDLVNRKVDVILTVNTAAAQAAKRSTATIPIVVTRVADPIKSGLVTSLARPDGNVTGLSFLPEDVAAKHLQLLKEVLPTISRVAHLWYVDNPGSEIVLNTIKSSSAELGMTLILLPVRAPTDFVRAFEAARRGRAEALTVTDDAMVTRHRRHILELAAKQSLGVISFYRDVVEAGGLMAYGANPPAIYRRAGYYVAKILNGAKPSDLPIEQPTKFDLVINLKTAKALGLTIPPSLLLRADEVIE